MRSNSSSSFTEPGTFSPAKYFHSSMGGGARSTCRRVSCAVAGHGHPHLPKGQICGINATEHAVLALLPDQFLQNDYIMFLLPVGSTMNTVDSPSMRQIRARGAPSAIEDCEGVDVDRVN
jgi:hypothetical protein